MRLSPVPNQPEHDLVFTPNELAIDIIQHFQPYGRILDPCKGNGAFFDHFPGEDNTWCEISLDKDFFDYNQPVDWIITNPPWSKIRQFLEHSYTLTNNIVFLITINHIMTKARMRKMIACNFGIVEFYGVKTPSKPWPPSGFQLAACHLQKDYHGKTAFSGIFGS